MREDGEQNPTVAYTAHGNLPVDAELMGLDRNTEEGAMVAMAASLTPSKVSHRVIAWLLLLSFAVPHLLGLVPDIF